jgi:hypothetical protein
MAESELHKRLVLHLADTLKARDDDVQAVAAPGHPWQWEVFRWRWSEGRFPDVIARRGRRRIYGDAKLGARDVKRPLPQLALFAALSRELVICVPEAELRATAGALADAWGLRRHFGRLRLLGDESSDIHSLNKLL